MKVIWLSANKFGHELLKEAVKIEGFDLRAIITLSDNSKTIIYDSVPKVKWNQFGVEVVEVEKLNDEKKTVRALSPDLIIMCGWRQIISKEILEMPSRGVIGFHPTLLPFGRGPAPIINTILQGVNLSGLTMFYVDEGLDSGDIIAQGSFPISEIDHADDVYKKIIKEGRKLIRQHLPSVINGKTSRIPQEGSKATLFEKPSKDFNKIDLRKENLEYIYRKIKALSKPYKGAYIERDGKRLILWRAELQEIK